MVNRLNKDAKVIQWEKGRSFQQMLLEQLDLREYNKPQHLTPYRKTS